ncbi:integrase [Inquilinus ginsengisoli]|uniref:tyrosine-type recombinase/integrase n=1 Tax=Inquilinus ginsengisoli TaxID=363840 RepID=UPI003D1ED229
MKDKLSAVQVRRLKEPGRYSDGNGLYLQVRSAEQKSYLFRYMRNGNAHWMGLGPADILDLKDAREKARGMRRLLLDGIDPLEHKRAERAKAVADAAKVVTFKEAAKRYIAKFEPTWKNPKHRQQWKNTLEQYAYPAIGALDVAAIDTPAVRRVITDEFWTRVPETASRLRGRLETVLDYAAAENWRPQGLNPAAWKGCLEPLLPKVEKTKRAKRQQNGGGDGHFPALPYPQIGAFITKLRAKNGVAARALEYTILTAARSNETYGARWPEIDLDAALWTVPGDKMKGEREHVVPLSEAALAVLREMLELRDAKHGDYVFPGGKKGRGLSNMAMAKVIRDLNEVPEGQPKPWVDPKMGGRGATVHGMRSCFRDWAGETTGYPVEVAEAALAHGIKDKARAAYERGAKLDKRRWMMADWAAFCALPSREPGASGEADANILQFNQAPTAAG